jgi:hypothetical protein
MADADAPAHWTARLRDLATREGVPGATLGIWADGRETLAAHGVLNPADDTGDHFAGRLYDSAPWSPVVFGRLGDQTPYIYASGRVTPRVG